MVAHTTVPALEKLRQQDYGFEANPGYTAKPFLKNKQINFLNKIKNFNRLCKKKKNHSPKWILLPLYF
jgi:hypothetical protein